MIYLLEDDDSIRELVIYTLNSQGMEARGFAQPSAFWEAMGEQTPSLALLDVMLPGEDGVAILKKLKASDKTRGIPVIMATAKGAEFDKIVSLDLGADDYLVKPFGMMEMVARVKAVLRRAAPKTDPQILSLGGLTMHTGEHIVTANGVRVTLTLKEYEMLKLFLSHPGLVFTRDQLLSEIWGMDYDGETRTVDVHIRTLRQKLGACGACIETVRGVGYRMEVPSV